MRVRAPFAAFRGMQAGAYRSTAPVIPFSAAWGLLLNFGGIETRRSDVPTTLVSDDAPNLELAIGAVSPATVTTLYQQLHAYPVGSSGKELKARAHGAKYWIQPVRRELLVDLDCVVGARGADDVLKRIEAGIQGRLDLDRYGLPFAGDNNLLIDRVEVLNSAVPIAWYAPLQDGEAHHEGSCRLTIRVDRADASRTTFLLCAPMIPSIEVPEAAWTWTPRVAQPSPDLV